MRIRLPLDAEDALGKRIDLITVSSLRQCESAFAAGWQKPVMPDPPAEKRLHSSLEE